jgi:hypothetical protein
MAKLVDQLSITISSTILLYPSLQDADVVEKMRILHDMWAALLDDASTDV